MAVAVIWKIEKSQYLCYGWTSFQNIWSGDVPRSSRPPQHIKFYAFKNSTWWPIVIWKKILKINTKNAWQSPANNLLGVAVSTPIK